MKYEKFAALVKENLPNVEWVGKHGDCCTNPSKNTLGVVFKGTKKVYDYHGTYVQILNQLGYRCTTESVVKAISDRLEYLKETNGKKTLLGIANHDKEIKLYEEQLAELKALPIVDK